MSFFPVHVKPTHFFFLLCFFLFTCCSSKIQVNANPSKPPSSPVYFAERLKEAHKGDYFVLHNNKTYTVFRIFDLSPPFITLEELSVLEDKFHPLKLSWDQWLLKKAPRHHSWILYEFHLEEALLTELYSISEAQFLSFHHSHNFVSTLLRLPLIKVPKEKRKRLGPSLTPSDITNRPLWHPPLIYKGSSQGKVAFEAFEAIWPEDGSELAGKQLELYFPLQKGPFPNYFPYWLQVPGQLLRYRVIDSGRETSFSKQSLPRRNPSFLQVNNQPPKKLSFHLSISPFHRPFKLLAINDEEQAVELSYTLQEQNSREVKGFISLKHLKKGMPYTLVLFSPSLPNQSFSYHNKIVIN